MKLHQMEMDSDDKKNHNAQTFQCYHILGKKSADNILKYFSDFSHQTGFDLSCKLSPQQTISMKRFCQFSGEN